MQGGFQSYTYTRRFLIFYLYKEVFNLFYLYKPVLIYALVPFIIYIILSGHENILDCVNFMQGYLTSLTSCLHTNKIWMRLGRAGRNRVGALTFPPPPHLQAIFVQVFSEKIAKNKRNLSINWQFVNKFRNANQFARGIQSKSVRGPVGGGANPPRTGGFGGWRPHNTLFLILEQKRIFVLILFVTRSKFVLEDSKEKIPTNLFFENFFLECSIYSLYMFWYFKSANIYIFVKKYITFFPPIILSHY